MLSSSQRERSDYNKDDYNYHYDNCSTGNGKTAAGYWGDYNCDVPLWTLEDLFQKLAQKSDEVI